MEEVFMEEPFGTSNHCFIRFKMIMDRDRAGPRVKMLNWGKANFEGMRQELAQVDWSRLFDGKKTSGKWDVFKECAIFKKGCRVKAGFYRPMSGRKVTTEYSVCI